MLFDDVLKQLTKIERQRAIVKQSLASDAMKAKLLEQLDAQTKLLEGSLEAPKTPSKG